MTTVGRLLAGTSRRRGFAVVTGTYLVAAGVAGLVAGGRHSLAATFWADIVATGVVFAASMAVFNASLYDPYWSVAPAVIVVAWVAASDAVAARGIVVLVLVLIWAVRLTANWALGWRGLAHEDWRYVQIRRDTAGRVPWWLVNFTGIQLMPTLVVFAGLLPVWPAVTVPAPLNPMDLVALAVTLGAIALEAAADHQIRHFTKNPANGGGIADGGLWRYSRHPNYLGEIAFWWGMWLFALAAAPRWWWTVLGPLAMVVLFVFVSVPLMDRRSLSRRPAYAEHMRRVPALLPLPRFARRSTGGDIQG
jgi:steroid 5-alpha reductase family enzyme